MGIERAPAGGIFVPKALSVPATLLVRCEMVSQAQECKVCRWEQSCAASFAQENLLFVLNALQALKLKWTVIKHKPFH